MAETENEGVNAPGVEMGETEGEKNAHPSSHYIPPNDRAEGPGEGEPDEGPA